MDLGSVTDEAGVLNGRMRPPSESRERIVRRTRPQHRNPVESALAGRGGTSRVWARRVACGRAARYAVVVLTPFDHLLFVVLSLLGPVWGATVGYRRLIRADACDLPRVRGSVYRAAIAMQWTLTAAAVALWLATGRPWSLLGVVPHPTWGLGGTALGAAIVIVFVIRQRREAIAADEALDEVRERMRHVEPMLPRTPAEMRTFVKLAFTAGICEELLYRGFMIFYVSRFTNLFAAAAIVSVIFGIGHLYQGRRGVVLTAFAGAFFAAVYLVSGSLFVAMLLHVLMDLHSGHLAYVALRRADEREAERLREWEAQRREWEADAAAAAASRAAAVNADDFAPQVPDLSVDPGIVSGTTADIVTEERPT